MTREEALLKLLAVEPDTKDQIILATGWPADETAAVLESLIADRRVTFTNWVGNTHGRRMYYPREA